MEHNQTEMKSAEAGYHLPKLLSWIALGVFVVLHALGWLMAIGGTGKLNDDCQDYGTFSCQDEFRDIWWAIFLQLFVVLAVAVVAGTGNLDKCRIPLSVFLGLSTYYQMSCADKALSLIKSSSGSSADEALSLIKSSYGSSADEALSLIESSYGSSSDPDAMRTAAGGFIILSLLDFLLIIAVGVGIKLELGNLANIISGKASKAPTAPVAVESVNRVENRPQPMWTGAEAGMHNQPQYYPSGPALPDYNSPTAPAMPQPGVDTHK